MSEHMSPNLERAERDAALHNRRIAAVCAVHQDFRRCIVGPANHPPTEAEEQAAALLTLAYFTLRSGEDQARAVYATGPV